jgi:hypothetical protein
MAINNTSGPLPDVLGRVRVGSPVMWRFPTGELPLTATSYQIRLVKVDFLFSRRRQASSV